jgi:RimJ/RimL family protein N-acetyltransferase
MFQFGSVLFRAIEKQDLELLREWENDSELMMYSRSKPLNFTNMAQLEKQFEEWLKEEKNLHFIIELVDKKEPIGTARLEQRDWGNVKTGHIGTYIAKKELWGKGIGRQITVALLEMAFMQLNVERCDAGSVEYNSRAHKTLTACGFKKSGTYRKIHYVNGRKWDHFYFDLLREEYLSVRMELLRQTLGDKLEEYLQMNQIPER